MLKVHVKLLVEELHALRVDAACSVGSSGRAILLIFSPAHFHVLLIVVFRAVLSVFSAFVGIVVALSIGAAIAILRCAIDDFNDIIAEDSERKL